MSLPLTDFRLVLRHDPNNTDALINLGLAYWLAGRPGEAKDSFEKALKAELDPKWRPRLASYIKELSSGKASGSPAGLSPEDDVFQREPESDNRHDPVEPPIRLLRHPRTASVGPGFDPKAWSGRWEGSYMGSKLRIEFKQSGGKISGVLRVHALTGREDVFHFTGAFDGKKIVASHSDGHRFSGKLTDNQRLVGVLTTSNGVKINVDMSLNQ